MPLYVEIFFATLISPLWDPTHPLSFSYLWHTQAQALASTFIMYHINSNAFIIIMASWDAHIKKMDITFFHMLMNLYMRPKWFFSHKNSFILALGWPMIFVLNTWTSSISMNAYNFPPHNYTCIATKASTTMYICIAS